MFDQLIAPVGDSGVAVHGRGSAALSDSPASDAVDRRYLNHRPPGLRKSFAELVDRRGGGNNYHEHVSDCGEVEAEGREVGSPSRQLRADNTSVLHV